MSLFGNPDYRWRETYLILFPAANRPTTAAITKAFSASKDHLQITDIQGSEDGLLESLTVHSPGDYSAMDISYVEGEEVTEQIPELALELRQNTADAEELAQVKVVEKSSARLDVMHFQQHAAGAESEEEEDAFIDPGGVLRVLSILSQACRGVAVDPQSGVIVSSS
jgi:uncharacterized protein involved in exopolysaccharide biosynthesis